MNLNSELKEICALPDGVDLIGVAPSERFLDLPENKRPTTFLPKTKWVIVIGSQLFKVLTKKLTVQKKIGEVSYRELLELHRDGAYRTRSWSVQRDCFYVLHRPQTSRRTGQVRFPFQPS